MGAQQYLIRWGPHPPRRGGSMRPLPNYFGQLSDVGGPGDVEYRRVASPIDSTLHPVTYTLTKQLKHCKKSENLIKQLNK